MNVELEEMEERVGNHGDCAVEFWYPVSSESEESWGNIPASTPYCSSKGLPVSLQIGNGVYCNSCLSFSICSPVSLYRSISFGFFIHSLAGKLGDPFLQFQFQYYYRRP